MCVAFIQTSRPIPNGPAIRSTSQVLIESCTHKILADASTKCFLLQVVYHKMSRETTLKSEAP